MRKLMKLGGLAFCCAIAVVALAACNPNPPADNSFVNKLNAEGGNKKITVTFEAPERADVKGYAYSWFEGTTEASGYVAEWTEIKIADAETVSAVPASSGVTAQAEKVTFEILGGAEGLKVGTTYTVSVKAAFGETADTASGAASGATVLADFGTVKTVTGETHGVPAKPVITVKDLGNGELEVTAAAPESDLDVTGYKVSYGTTAVETPDDAAWTTKNVNPISAEDKGLSYKITGLTAGTKYSVKVIAVSDAGESAESDAAVDKIATTNAGPATWGIDEVAAVEDDEDTAEDETAAEIPAKPAYVDNLDGSVTLNWTLPEIATGEAISGIKIMVGTYEITKAAVPATGTEGDDDYVAEVPAVYGWVYEQFGETELAKTATTVNVTGLTLGETYRFQVIVCNMTTEAVLESHVTTVDAVAGVEDDEDTTEIDETVEAVEAVQGMVFGEEEDEVAAEDGLTLDNFAEGTATVSATDDTGATVTVELAYGEAVSSKVRIEVTTKTGATKIAAVDFEVVEDVAVSGNTPALNKVEKTTFKKHADNDEWIEDEAAADTTYDTIEAVDAADALVLSLTAKLAAGTDYVVTVIVTSELGDDEDYMETTKEFKTAGTAATGA